jgi:acetyl/propionyl-CoA carboxylase alpha subunit
MRHLFIIEDEKIEAWLIRRGGGYVLLIGEREYSVMLRENGDGSAELTVGDRTWRVDLALDAETTHVRMEGECHAVRWSDPLVRLAHHGGAELEDIAQAPMPGVVIAVNVRPGDAVVRGQAMMVIESMKLETAIPAWRDGTVKTVHLAMGQSFDRAAPLITLEPEPGA